MREFRDDKGVDWIVFHTPRGAQAVAREQHLPEEYRHGWLVFESEAGEKRRFAPVPSDWESFTDDELRELCGRATQQLPRFRRTPAAHPSAPANDPAGSSEALTPKLFAVQEQLKDALGEVCDLPSSSKLTTGELIRVEETLALAAEAAKEAVSLRRRLRTDRERGTS